VNGVCPGAVTVAVWVTVTVVPAPLADTTSAPAATID
jgi:hypothetical protein